MPKNRFFSHISGIFGRKQIFSKTGLGHVMSIANMHLCAKKWKKSNGEISRKAGNRRTNERTNERTDGRTDKG